MIYQQWRIRWKSNLKIAWKLGLCRVDRVGLGLIYLTNPVSGPHDN